MGREASYNKRIGGGPDLTAYNYYLQAISIYEKHYGAQDALGWELIGLNRPEVAIRQFERIGQLFPNASTDASGRINGIAVVERQIETNKKYSRNYY